MNSIEQRLTALELRSQNDDCVPALVQVIGPEGRSPEQIHAAAAALKNGARIITIMEYDATRHDSLS
jgi:hypothetical protein